MNEIKPIQTYYDGHKFRSRLEARWAVVFNYLGVPYEYEPEGFNLGGGLYYLPDFRVKCHGKRGVCDGKPFDLYIEVKGQMSPQDAQKLKLFSATNPVLIVDRIPHEGCATDWAMSEFDMGDDLSPFNYMLIDSDYFPAYPATTSDGHFYLFGGDSNYINLVDVPRMENAYREARCARFEHGETPPNAMEFAMLRAAGRIR